MPSNYRDIAPMLSNAYDHVRPNDEAERLYLESLVREDYGRTHPSDSFDDMRRRLPFSPEDQGLYRDWLAIAASRARAAAAEAPLTVAAE